MIYSRKSALLFQLVMRHNYFSDGLAKGLTIAPTPNALSQLSRFNARFIADEGGGFVAFPQVTTQVIDKAPAGLPDNISLAISQQDTTFLNYTDLDIPPQGMVWYSNNLGALAGAATPLTALKLQPPAFQIDFQGRAWPAHPDGGRQLKISRLNGEMVSDQSYYQVPGDSVCKVNMAGFSDGAYTLEWTVQGGTVPFRATFFKWEPGMQLPPLAFFEWYAKGKRPSPIGQAIHLTFQARETFWQYYLVSRNGKKVKNPSITLLGGAAKFVQTGEMLPLPNGSFATCLSATQPLPLQERPEMEITLHAEGIRKGMSLPYASPNILYDTGPGGKPSSRIYVYF